MATYNSFNIFVKDLIDGIHNLAAAGDTLNAYLTNNTPDAENDAVKTDLVGITEQNGYAAADIQNDTTRTAGTSKCTAVDKEWTASGGSFGPFQYAVIYNETTTGKTDPLICWWNYGSSITVNDGEKFKIDFGTELFSIS